MSLDHVFGDRGQSDLKSELEQFAVDARCSPKRIIRFRSVVQGPDGSLYTAVDEGVIHKLTPQK